jgi:RimJ/RimL family protein N-acetyltransferase
MSAAPIDRSSVTLRPLAEADVDAIMTWVNDPQIVGSIASFSGEPFTREQELAYVRRMMASEDDRVFSIVRAADGGYLGQVGLHQIHRRSRVARLACIIGSRSEMGRGYGTAAVARILDHAFGHEELHKVWLMIFSTNQRSRRVYERLGFQEEGVLREEYFHEGTWHDMARMSLLGREW